MKNYIYLPGLLFILIMSSCNQNKNQSKIILQTTGFEDSTKIFLMDTERTQLVDSGYIVDNNLIFSVEVNEPTLFLMYPVRERREDYEVKMFWKENKILKIYAEKGKLKNARIEGSEIQIQADIVEADKTKLRHINDSLRNEYRLLSKEDTEKRRLIREKGREIEQAISDVDINYIKSKPSELYSAFTLKGLMKYTIPKSETQELFENLNTEIQSSKYGLLIKKFLDLSRDLEIGDKALNFQLSDLEGNLVELKDFGGKYILLDFWSSNCGPCRMENPNLLRNYKAYKDRGFEIISISLDKNKNEWENAVKKDSMIWTTVSDLQGPDGDIPITYNVYMFPTYFLIDTNGVIIDKFLGRGQLDDKLKGLFSN